MSGLVFGGTGNVGHLFVYDPVLDESTDLGVALYGQKRVLSLLLGLDGFVYGGSGATNVDGHLFRFHPANPTLVQDLGTPVPGARQIGSLTLGPGDVIYGGTADQPMVFSLDPVEGMTQAVWQVPGVNRVISLAAGPDGRLYGGGYPSGGMFWLDPGTGQSEYLGVPVGGEYSVEALVTGPDGKLYGGTRSGKGYLFSYDPATNTFALYGAPVWRDRSLLSLVVGSDGWIYGGTGSARGRLFRFDPVNRPYASSGTATSISISPRMQHKTFVPGTSDVYALTVASDGWVYAGGYGTPQPAKLARWDPAMGGMMELLGNVPGWPSAVHDLMQGPDGKIYGGAGSFGTTANLFSYDPASHTFDYMPPGIPNQNYVHSLALCPNGLIYGGTGSVGVASGELFAYNPANGEFSFFGVVIPGERQIRSLACSPGGVVYGGTGPNAHLFAFEPWSGFVDLGRPVEGETRVSALAWGPDGKLYGGTVGSGHLFRYDPAGGSLVDLGRPIPADTGIHGLETGADGRVYGVSGYVGGHLFVYDPARDEVADLGKAHPAERYASSLALSADAGQVYLGTGTSLGELVVYEPGYDFAWLQLGYQAVAPDGTGLSVDVLDLDGNVLLVGVPPGASLLGTPAAGVPAIKLRARLDTSDPGLTPALLEWSVTWTQEPVLAVTPSGLAFEAHVGGPNPAPQALSLENLGAGALPWTLSGLPVWLTAEPGSGTAPSVVTVSASVSGLDAGAYTAVLTVEGPAGCLNCPVDVPVALTVYDVQVLDVTPSSLAFVAVEGDTEPRMAEVVLDNVGTGVLTWTAEIDAPWLSLLPEAGVVPPAATVLVAADPTGLPAGDYTGVITFSGPPTCANCPQVVSVELTVELPPILEVTPASLLFQAAVGGADPAPMSLSVENVGGGELPWTLSGLPAWLSAEPVSGTAPSLVTVSASIEGLDAGEYTATLTVDGPADCPNCPVDVPVVLMIYDVPALSVTPSALAFVAVQGETAPRTAELVVDNVGTGVLTWTAEIDAPWLSIAPEAGVVPPAAAVLVAADPTGLAAGTYTGVITFTGSPVCGNCPQVVSVSLTVEPPPIIQVTPPMVAITTTEGLPDPAPLALQVGNAGGGTLIWQAAGSLPWLWADPPGGTVAEPLWLHFQLAGLGVGVHEATLTVTDQAGLAEPVEVPVRVEIRPAPRRIFLPVILRH